ncbi:hypothetical protein [Streptomyces sp. NPDC020362]|uniref:hypothetical protein n=1 Tax=unclassified Streptomyces TaxID=2593676 RepID=UPI0033BFB957
MQGRLERIDRRLGQLACHVAEEQAHGPVRGRQLPAHADGERPQVHHRRAGIRSEILAGDGEETSFATGTDVIVLDEDGRISSVTVFLDRAPEGFDAVAHDQATTKPTTGYAGRNPALLPRRRRRARHRCRGGSADGAQQ